MIADALRNKAFDAKIPLLDTSFSQVFKGKQKTSGLLVCINQSLFHFELPNFHPLLLDRINQLLRSLQQSCSSSLLRQKISRTEL